MRPVATVAPIPSADSRSRDRTAPRAEIEAARLEAMNPAERRSAPAAAARRASREVAAAEAGVQIAAAAIVVVAVTAAEGERVDDYDYK